MAMQQAVGQSVNELTGCKGVCKLRAGITITVALYEPYWRKLCYGGVACHSSWVPNITDK